MDEERSAHASLEESQAPQPRRPKPRDEFEGVAIGGRYLLKKRIGEGGFGAVYEAVDERFDSPVAVKLLFGRSDESELTFRKEAKLIRRFKHPNVVEVYDYGVDDGVAFIVMEYLNGTPTHKYFERRDRRLPNDTVRKFVTEIGSALENAHAKHLVHRDLKPQNVMLVDEGQSSERFVLLDLGMATKTDAARDETIGNMANSGLTPQYAPPEQFRQLPATHLSDIYSFGTILYHLLCGRLPFPHASTLGQLWHAVEHDTPSLFAEAAPDRTIPEEVEALVRQCLEKKPENRPQSMREIRERFLKALQPRSSRETVEWTSGTAPSFLTGDKTDPHSHQTHTPTDLLSGLRGASGSATMPVSGSATMPESALGPRTDWRTPQRALSQRPWLAIAGISVLLVLAIGLVVVATVGRDPQAVQPPVTIAESEPWVLDVGRSRSFDLAVVKEAGFEGPVEFTVRGLPEYVTAEPVTSAADVVGINVTAAPEARPVDVPLRVVATVGGLETDQTITLRLVWLPPEDFFVPGVLDDGGVAGLVKSRRTDWNLYEQLDRLLDDETRVPFVLILDEADRDSRPAPFYIMRNKVWNGLYAAFAGDQDGLDQKWRESVAANDPDQADPGWSNLPVMNVSALDALKFANWLGGTRGHLPRLEQWRTASGFYEYDLSAGRFQDERWKAWQAGPYRGPRVAVGAFSAGRRLPLVLGEADVDSHEAPGDDISPRYSVRDMAGNGSEWTSELMRPPGRLTSTSSSEHEVFLLGANYLASNPLVYEDLADPDAIAVSPSGYSDSITSFRVVLEPP